MNTYVQRPQNKIDKSAELYRSTYFMCLKTFHTIGLPSKTQQVPLRRKIKKQNLVLDANMRWRVERAVLFRFYFKAIFLVPRDQVSHSPSPADRQLLPQSTQALNLPQYKKDTRSNSAQNVEQGTGAAQGEEQGDVLEAPLARQVVMARGTQQILHVMQAFSICAALDRVELGCE